MSPPAADGRCCPCCGLPKLLVCQTELASLKTEAAAARARAEDAEAEVARLRAHLFHQASDR